MVADEVPEKRDPGRGGGDLWEGAGEGRGGVGWLVLVVGRGGFGWGSKGGFCGGGKNEKKRARRGG